MSSKEPLVLSCVAKVSRRNTVFVRQVSSFFFFAKLDRMSKTSSLALGYPKHHVDAVREQLYVEPPGQHLARGHPLP